MVVTIFTFSSILMYIVHNIYIICIHIHVNDSSTYFIILFLLIKNTTNIIIKINNI